MQTLDEDDQGHRFKGFINYKVENDHKDLGENWMCVRRKSKRQFTRLLCSLINFYSLNKDLVA